MATATVPTQAMERQRPRFSLTERELHKYSLARAILVSADNQEGSDRAERNCFELEVSQSIEKTVTGKRYGGVFIPWNIGAGEFARQGPEQHPETRGARHRDRDEGQRTQVHRAW